jgi:hypothetical protein
MLVITGQCVLGLRAGRTYPQNGREEQCRYEKYHGIDRRLSVLMEHQVDGRRPENEENALPSMIESFSGRAQYKNLVDLRKVRSPVSSQ